jgi:hypothetical protein
MPVVELVSLATVQTLTQDVVYALPSRGARIFTSLPLEVSNVVNFATFGTVDANATRNMAAGFVRSTTGNAVVRLVVT